MRVTSLVCAVALLPLLGLAAAPLRSGDVVVATVQAHASPGDVPHARVYVISNGSVRLLASSTAGYRDMLVLSPAQIIGTYGTSIESISSDGIVTPFLVNLEEGASWLSPAGSRGFVQATSVSPKVFVRGATVQSYNVGYQGGGVDLDADLCTLYFTAADTTVRRHDVCTDVPGGMVASPGGIGFSVRILSDGSLLTRGFASVQRFAPDGSLMRTYPKMFATFAIAKAGTSIWGVTGTNRVGRMDLTTGDIVEGPIELDTNEIITAVAVADEPRRALSAAASTAFATDIPAMTSVALAILLLLLAAVAVRQC
jgi:hypothetical protein